VGWRSAVFGRPHVSHHDDIVVRLHQGPHHGRVIAIPEPVRRSGILAVPTREGTDLAEAGPWQVSFRTVFYRRRELPWYDDVDHTIHLESYWMVEDGQLPTRRLADGRGRPRRITLAAAA